MGILDPNSHAVRTVEPALQAAGHDTVAMPELQAAVNLVSRGNVDLVILSGAGGLDALRELRAAGAVLPIVVLVDPQHDDPHHDEVVSALEAGAQDVLRTPVRTDELVARVDRLLGAASGPRLVLTAGDLELDLRAPRVRIGGRPVALTPRELRLLEVFLLHPRETLSPERLAALSDHADRPADPASVEREVDGLRAKLGPRRIETVPGRGYRLDPSAGEPAPPAA